MVKEIISLGRSDFREDKGRESVLYSVLDVGKFGYGKVRVPENFMKRFWWELDFAL